MTMPHLMGIDVGTTGARAVIALALADSGLSGEEIGAVGLSGQMHGLVLLDARGEVLRPGAWMVRFCS